jgi:Flp pilus assembly protein CpaB
MTYRVRNIVIAVALALVAGLLSIFYVSNYKANVQHEAKTVNVYVAKNDIPVGTTGADIVRRHLLTTTQIATRSVVPGAISDQAQVANLVTTQPILAKEQITLRRFANRAELGARAQLHGTLRAIAIEGDGPQLLSGVLKAGDHVDIVASFSGPNGNGTISRDVVRNLLVIQAGTESAAGRLSSGGGNGGSVLLAASEQRQIQKIWWTMKNADGWSLQLRPVSNATDSPEDVESPQSMAIDGVNAANRNHAINGSPK